MSRTIIVDDPVVAGLLSRLPSAAALGHSRRSFLEHLLCTWRILADWRMPVAVCRAGFMHSAYSTSFYPHALFRLDERNAVTRMIGHEAEELAYRFCTMDRRGFWDALVKRPRSGTLTYPSRLRAGAAVRVSRKTLRSLLIIESANIAEQARAGDDGPAPWMSRLVNWWGFLEDRYIPLGPSVRPRLTKSADQRAIAAYRLALQAPAKRALSHLECAIEHNPWAAEPRIMHALCALEGNQPGAAGEARAGAELLSSWAVCWDKRLSVNGWKALAARIQSAPRKRVSKQPSFESIRAALCGRGPAPRWLRV